MGPKTYTKEQLIEAMLKYNENYIKSLNGDETVGKFTEIDNTKECAISQVEYLLTFVE
jgi:hypothetical protein